MKTNILRHVSIALSLLAFLFVMSGDASSSTLPALTGHAWRPDEQGCFASGWSRVRNGCTDGSHKLLIAVPITYRNARTHSFYAASENDTTRWAGPQCRALTTDTANGLVAQTGLITLGRGPAYTFLGTLSTSFAHFDCDIMPDPTGLGLTAVQWIANP